MSDLCLFFFLPTLCYLSCILTSCFIPKGWIKKLCIRLLCDRIHCHVFSITWFTAADKQLITKLKNIQYMWTVLPSKGFGILFSHVVNQPELDPWLLCRLHQNKAIQIAHPWVWLDNKATEAALMESSLHSRYLYLFSVSDSPVQ